jgi:hypothetical protein
MNEQYIRAYQRTPETKEEIQAARRAANAILVEEPWQEAEHEAGEDIKTGRVKIFESAEDLFKDGGKVSST